MEKFNEKLKKRILEEIYETCVKKEFLKHEKTEYNISALEKTLLQNTTHKNISTLIIKQAGIKSIPATLTTQGLAMQSNGWKLPTIRLQRSGWTVVLKAKGLLTGSL